MLIFQTHDRGHQTRSTLSKKTMNSNSKSTNIEG